MKIIHYCQHVLGIGHLFRSLEICRALAAHEVILVSGGPRVVTQLPRHVREFRLPELQMDREFKSLFSAQPNSTLDQVRQARQTQLYDLFKIERPDIFITELYPFGRKAFRFELDPLLQAIRSGRLPSCGIFSSVRDILVEKEKQAKHEARVVRTLNSYFDAVLVHSDPQVIKFEETFYRFNEICIPMVYTGFIAPKPAGDSRKRIRTQLGIGEGDRLILASAGGGSVGLPLLESVIRGVKRLNLTGSCVLQVYTGPFIEKEDFARLKALAAPGVLVEAFTSDFLGHLAAADLSISMAGYNTSMNILAAQIPALVWPFPQNREQRLRAERLAGLGVVTVLNDQDLLPERLGDLIARMLSRSERASADVDLEGAANTARWIETWADKML